MSLNSAFGLFIYPRAARTKEIGKINMGNWNIIVGIKSISPRTRILPIEGNGGLCSTYLGFIVVSPLQRTSRSPHDASLSYAAGWAGGRIPDLFNNSSLETKASSKYISYQLLEIVISCMWSSNSLVGLSLDFIARPPGITTFFSRDAVLTQVLCI